METAYAQALMKMLAKGMKPKEAVEALHQLLVRTGRETLLSKIGRAFQRLAARESGQTDVVLTTARESDERAARKGAGAVLFAMNANADDVSVRVDDSLIGGWRLEGREHLIDASFKKQLLSLYNRATQS